MRPDLKIFAIFVLLVLLISACNSDRDDSEKGNEDRVNSPGSLGQRSGDYLYDKVQKFDQGVMQSEDGILPEQSVILTFQEGGYRVACLFQGDFQEFLYESNSNLLNVYCLNRNERFQIVSLNGNALVLRLGPSNEPHFDLYFNKISESEAQRLMGPRSR